MISLTYIQFLALVFVPPAVLFAALAVRRRRRPDRRPAVGGASARYLVGVALVTTIGLAWTTPWDNYLLGRGVWWYGDGVVGATVWRAPVGEYLFMLLQPLLTAAWLLRVRPVRWPDVRVGRRDRLVGAAAGLAVSAVGLGLFALGGRYTYLGAILAWAGPVFAVQWAFGWPMLVAAAPRVALAVLVPTVYLCLVDAAAIAAGLWTLSPALTTGLAVGVLPVEEALFFLVTNGFVVGGLALYGWVVDDLPAADARSVLRAVAGRPEAPAAEGRPRR